MPSISVASSSKSSDGKIFLDPAGRACFRYHQVSHLEVPAENDLCGGPVVLVRQRGNGGVGQDLPAAQRTPGFSGDAELFVQSSQPALLKPGVQLDLVYCGNNFSLLHQLFQVSGLEVGHADGPHFPFPVQGLQSFVGLCKQTPPGAGPVDEVEVHIVEPKVGDGSIERPERGIVALVIVPDLGGDEEVLACECVHGFAGAAGGSVRFSGVSDRTAKRPAHSYFVAVHGGSIKAPVALAQGGGNQRFCVFGGNFIESVSHAVHLYAIVQRQLVDVSLEGDLIATTLPIPCTITSGMAVETHQASG